MTVHSQNYLLKSSRHPICIDEGIPNEDITPICCKSESKLCARCELGLFCVLIGGGVWHGFRFSPLEAWQMRSLKSNASTAVACWGTWQKFSYTPLRVCVCCRTRTFRLVPVTSPYIFCFIIPFLDYSSLPLLFSFSSPPFKLLERLSTVVVSNLKTFSCFLVFYATKNQMKQCINKHMFET